MTEMVFWADPYLRQLDTCVMRVDGNKVTVAETIFYALSGGQESDAGTIGGYDVLEAQWLDGDIVYTLADKHDLKPGDGVLIAIDWERRYRLMRLHFAAELVLEIVYRTFPAIQKIGAHIAADKARIDFAWDDTLSAHIPEIEEAVLELIRADHEIKSSFSDRANLRRTWHIAGFATVPCGGTHLRRTSEIGAVYLKRKNPGKGKERLEIYLSD